MVRRRGLIAKVANLYDPGLVYVESNQAQRIFGEELMRETDLPIKLFQTGDQKNSLSNGVPAIRILLENNKFRIPRGDAHSIEMTDIWIHEMTSMTIRSGKVTSLGDHDDTVSACWIAEQAIKNGSFDFSFEEEEGDT